MAPHIMRRRWTSGGEGGEARAEREGAAREEGAPPSARPWQARTSSLTPSVARQDGPGSGLPGSAEVVDPPKLASDSDEVRCSRSRPYLCSAKNEAAESSAERRTMIRQKRGTAFDKLACRQGIAPPGTHNMSSFP